jgi:hypothetical protein
MLNASLGANQKKLTTVKGGRMPLRRAKGTSQPMYELIRMDGMDYS